MSSNNRDPLIRVKGPALPPVTLHGDVNPTVERGELRRAKGPGLSPVMLRAEPVATPTVHLTVPLVSGTDADTLFAKLHAVIAKVNELEALFDRAGVWVDGTRSGVRGGAILIVLAPNDPADALETCKRVADHLFAAARKSAGTTVRVFAADQPAAAVYELAA